VHLFVFYYKNVLLILIFMYSRHKVEDSVLVGYDTAAMGNRFSTFRRNTVISNFTVTSHYGPSIRWQTFARWHSVLSQKKEILNTRPRNPRNSQNSELSRVQYQKHNFFHHSANQHRCNALHAEMLKFPSHFFTCCIASSPHFQVLSRSTSLVRKVLRLI
jgi:hypothetical protein